jgi:hypothetical protein
LKKFAGALVCLFASTVMGQVGGYLGPGVLSSGAGTIGTRSGEQMDLRFFVDVMGVYDNGLEPFAVNSQGQLETLNGLYGEQIDVGAYGQHQWRQALLGIDYRGNLYHYDNASSADGTSQSLSLGYTYQKSRRLAFNLRGTGGTTSLGYGSPGFYGVSTPGNIVGQPTELLFDNRVYYVQGGADVTFILSPRTIITAGGDAFATRYQAAGLIGLDGYSMRGSLQHRLSRSQTLGVNYQHEQFNYVRSYGQSTLNVVELFFATSIGKLWTLSISAGGYQSQVSGVQQVSLSPVIAALLGQSFGFQTFYTVNYYPSGSVRLNRKFKTANLGASYAQTVVPGNGVYLTSRQDAGSLSYSYTGIRKWNFGLSGGYYKLGSIGQQLQSYAMYTAGAGFTYNLTRAFHVVGRYDLRHQDIASSGFRENASRVSVGLAFSPGTVPLSLW